MTRRAVIFDVDGVLVDSYHAHMKAWMIIGEKLGRTITEEQFIPTFGRRNDEVFHWLLDHAVPDSEIPRWGDLKEEVYRRILAEDFPEMDGAVELVESLKAAGFALAVGSSGPPENVEAAMAGLGRRRLFDAFANGVEVAHSKPDPAVFLLAARKMAIDPRACAVVEDSLAGLEAAARAGMTPIALTGTFPRERLVGHADLVADSLRELRPGVVAELIDRRAHLNDKC